MVTARQKSAPHGADSVGASRRLRCPTASAGWWLLLAVAGVGCHPLAERVGRSPMKPAQMSPDASVVEIFLVRLPPSKPETYESLWREIDEQHFSAAVRQKLNANGIRAGLVAGQVPPRLGELLETEGSTAADGKPGEVSVARVNPDQPIRRSHHQLRPGRRNEIACGETLDDMVVLLSDGRHVGGETFQQAQALLGLQVFPRPDGTVALRMTPEVQYGAPHRQFSAASDTHAPGVFSMEFGRSKRAYPDLVIESRLAPGHMVVLASMPQRPESLGSRLFLRTADNKCEQKLVIVRLALTQHDDLLTPHPDPLPLGEIDGQVGSTPRAAKPDPPAAETIKPVAWLKRAPTLFGRR
jgi:hypothetical protein